MARDGAGGYARITPGTPYVINTTIDESVVNDEMDDLGNEIANSLSKDGQTVPTANLPMGGYKHTGVANGAARNHYAAVGQVQDNAFCTGTVAGTADAITLTLSPGLAAYATGQRFEFIAGSANTGAATLNINSLGAKSIKRDVSAVLLAGDIPSGGAVIVEYDGTNFQLLNPAKIGPITSAPITMATARILGRTTASTGAPEEISIGSGMTLSGGTLSLNDGRVIGRSYDEYATRTAISSVIAADDSVPTSAEGDEIMSRSYTAATTTNRLRIRVSVSGLLPGSGEAAVVTLVADGTVVKVGSSGGAGEYGQVSFEHELVPGSAAAKTYAVRCGVTGGNFYINGSNTARRFGGTEKATLIIDEIQAS